VLASIKRLFNKKRPLGQGGVTIVELLVVIGISSILLVSFMTVSVYMYGDTVRTSLYSQLATESQTVLRSVVEELRQSSSIRSSNANPDANAPSGAWTTSNSNLILIISTPALDSSNNFIIDTNTGYPYQNEIVYFASGNTLYKRFLANPSATGNTRQTTCPQSGSSSTCPPDIIMSTNFKTLNFIFYDQDDAVTTSIPNARSIKLFIQMERKTFGKTLQFDNNIRITIRNTYP
jgi:type II secretory pathway pseudopilin PulG